MCARRCRACAVEPLVARRLVGRLHRLQVGAERNLGVDDDLLTAGEMHDEVRTLLPAVTVGHAQLRGEVHVLGHAGGLDHPLELHLAPPPAYLRRAQGGDQLGGLGAQQLGRRAHRPDLLAQRRVGHRPSALDLVELVLHPPQRVAQRGDQRGQVAVAHQQLLTVGGGLALGFDAGAEGGRIGPGGVQGGLTALAREQPADGQAGDQRQQSDHELHGRR